MKRPEKIVKWFMVERKKVDSFVDHNGKPLFDYSIKLPYWIAYAYKPWYVKVEIRDKPLCYADMEKDGNKEETEKYLEANWRKKISKLWKLNHGFMFVSTVAKGQGWFKSVEDYNNYHKELQELNVKYGLSVGVKTT
jgi:hypothetical protein